MAYDQAGYSVGNPFAPKQILAGDTYTTRKITIAMGAAHKAGEVMGKITASSKYVLSASASADGSQTPDMVLLQDADATSADVEAIALETGPVVASGLTLGAGHTIAGIREGLRDKGILIDD